MSNSEGVSRNGSGEQHIRDDEFFEQDPNAARFRELAHALLRHSGATEEIVKKQLKGYGADDDVLERIFRAKQRSDQPPQQQQAQSNAAGEGENRERENKLREAALRLAEIREKGNKGSQFLRDLKKDGFTPDEIVQIDVAAGEPANKRVRKVKPIQESQSVAPDQQQSVGAEAVPPTQPAQSASATHEADPTQIEAAQKAERLRKKKEREAMTDNAYWIVRGKAKGKSEEELARSLEKAGFSKEVIEKTRELAASIEERKAGKGEEQKAEVNERVLRETARQIVRHWEQGVSNDKIEADLKASGWKEADIPEVFTVADMTQRRWTYDEAASLRPEYESPTMAQIKRAYDPIQRFFKKLSKDKQNNFKAFRARLIYGVSRESENEKRDGSAAKKEDIVWQRADNYHDFLRMCRGPLRGLHTRISVSGRDFLDRLADPKDPLHAYEEEWIALRNTIRRPQKGNFPRDEYAMAVLQGKIEIPEVTDEEAWAPLVPAPFSEDETIIEEWVPEVPTLISEEDLASPEIEDSAILNGAVKLTDDFEVADGRDIATSAEPVPDVDESQRVNPFLLQPDAQADLDAAIADVHAASDPSVEAIMPGEKESDGDVVEEPLALTPEEAEEQEILARAAENRRMAGSVPEEFEVPELLEIRKSYDPLFRLLKEIAEDPAVNFSIEDADLEYLVAIPSRDAKGEIEADQKTVRSYHDLLRLRASIPDDLLSESDDISWEWDEEDPTDKWDKFLVTANEEKLWDRLQDAKDPLHKYNERVDDLLDQIENESLIDEYAQAVSRGDIQLPTQEAEEIISKSSEAGQGWNANRGYGEINAMYGNEMPSDIREKYFLMFLKLVEAQRAEDADGVKAVTEEMRILVEEQWEATRDRRSGNDIDFDTWSNSLNSYELQYNAFSLPEGSVSMDVLSKIDELSYEFRGALNAGDEAKMAEVAAEADAFFAAQRLAVSEAKGTPSSEIESKNIQFDEVEAIVREQLRGKAKINNLTVNPTPDGLQLHAELDAGMMGGEIVLDGTIVNDGNTIAIHGLDIGARGFVKSIIQDKLGKFDTAIKTYFEKKFGKPISKMQIGGSGLSIELENQVAPIVSDQEEVTAGDEEDAVPDIDSRAEGVGLLKKTVEAAKGKLYEAKEKVKWWKSSEERLIRRRAELDVQAEKIGGVERWFRKLGERYNKLSFTKKVAIGAGLGVGAVVTAGSLAMAIPLLGIGAQRALGLATMYLKYEKESHDEAWGKNREWGKQKALLKAGVYTVIMGLTMKEAIELVSQTDLAHAAQAKVDGWLSSVFGNQSPTEAPRAAPAAPPAAPASSPAAPAATASSAPAAPQATAPEVAASQPEPVATGAEGAATAPAQAAPAEAAPAENVSGTKPADAPASAAEAAAEPSAPASEVAAAAQSEVSAQSAATAAETASAAEAPQSAGMNLIPDYASEAAAPTQPEIPAQPVLEAPRGPVEGMNFIPEYEPATEAPRPEVPTDTGRVGVQSSLSERESLVPDRAVEGPAGVAGTTANEVTVHPRAEGEDILIRTQEPAPLVDKDFFVNTFDVTVPIAEPHIYAGPPGTTTVFAYGGEKMVRLNAMFDYLKTHPDSTVIAEDDSGKYRAAWTLVKDRLVQGERLPQSGFFGRLSGALLPPPGPDELSKLIK